MSKKKHKELSLDDDIILDDDAISESDSSNHIYRVRLEWDKRDTQIYSGTSYEQALQEAQQHEGYKIYADDDGTLIEDPWKKVPVKSIVDNSPKPIICVTPGNRILLKDTLVYPNAINKTPMAQVSGQFYFYDDIISNNRVKITKQKEIDYLHPRLVLGYVNLDDLR